MRRAARSNVSVLPANLPLRVAAHAAAHIHTERPQPVIPIGHPGSRRAVTDQNDLLRAFRRQ